MSNLSSNLSPLSTFVIRHSPFVIFLLLLWPASADPESLQETIRASVSLVTVGVRVSDSKGRDIPGLKAEDFSIFDDDLAQRIAFFSSEEQPISLGILLDRSKSMEEGAKLEQAKVAAAALVRAGHRDTEFAFAEFGEKLATPLGFTPRREEVEAAILSARPRGGTSLYDAVFSMLSRFDGARHPRQALVVISDGADQHSQRTLDEVILRLQESKVQLYLIGYFSEAEDEYYRRSGPTIQLINGQEIDNPHLVFQRLSKESGADSYFPRSDLELEQAIMSISNDLRRQYTLAYYPPHPPDDGRYHRIRVKILRGGFKVRARLGYRLGSGGTDSLHSSLVEAERKSTHGKMGTEPPAYARKVETREGRTIYREDFSDPASGWPNSSRAFYDRGGYRLQSNGAGSIATQGPLFRNFRAQASIELRSKLEGQRLTGGSLWPTVGLIFRLNSSGHYAFLLQPAAAFQQWHIVLVKQSGTEFQRISRWPRQPVSGRKIRIGITCLDSTIALYLNDLLVGTVRDESLAEGVIGFLLNGQGYAVFDDLFVESFP